MALLEAKSIATEPNDNPVRNLARRGRMRSLMLAAVVTASPFVLSPPAHAVSRLGGVSVDRVCHYDFGYHAYVRYWSAWGWRCNPLPGNAYYASLDQGVDMYKACRLQYGGGAWASAADARNPYSWSCYR